MPPISKAFRIAGVCPLPVTVPPVALITVVPSQFTEAVLPQVIPPLASIRNPFRVKIPEELLSVSKPLTCKLDERVIVELEDMFTARGALDNLVEAVLFDKHRSFR